ncbi:MAG: hypothetical protein Q7K54_06475 [Candidatus Parcubacteria bacterium]|nr:hypothetical protein [Candidatus Parcubacteria bacterium]
MDKYKILIWVVGIFAILAYLITRIMYPDNYDLKHTVLLIGKYAVLIVFIIASWGIWYRKRR